MSGTAAWVTLPRLVSLRWPPRAAIVFCGILGTILPAIFGIVMGVPDPVIHDEFSYLLGADTFAHGRLTNPSPALPEFFEAPHVLVVPSYTSKYPPGQPLFLALGQMAGQPIWGVWLGCGLFAASLCWMLQAWSSRKWALTVTVLAIVTLGTSTYWAQSYWGGMPAAHWRRPDARRSAAHDAEATRHRQRPHGGGSDPPGQHPSIRRPSGLRARGGPAWVLADSRPALDGPSS